MFDIVLNMHMNNTGSNTHPGTSHGPFAGKKINAQTSNRICNVVTLEIIVTSTACILINVHMDRK